jgi:hypothetical protein
VLEFTFDEDTESARSPVEVRVILPGFRPVWRHSSKVAHENADSTDKQVGINFSWATGVVDPSYVHGIAVTSDRDFELFDHAELL